MGLYLCRWESGDINVNVSYNYASKRNTEVGGTLNLKLLRLIYISYSPREYDIRVQFLFTFLYFHVVFFAYFHVEHLFTCSYFRVVFFVYFHVDFFIYLFVLSCGILKRMKSNQQIKMFFFLQTSIHVYLHRFNLRHILFKHLHDLLHIMVV